MKWTKENRKMYMRAYRKKYRKEINLYKRLYYKTHPGVKKAERLRHEKRYPQKTMARNMIAYRVQSGILKRLPCEKCGDRKTEAHHPDYSKPLDVMWLCKKHHDEEHAKLKSMVRG